MRRWLQAEATLHTVVRDFEWVGLPTEPLSTRLHLSRRDKLTAYLRVGERVLKTSAERPNELAVAVSSFLQAGEALRGRPWPRVGPLGLLRPALKHGRAVWMMPNGQELCELGALFAPGTP